MRTVHLLALLGVLLIAALRPELVPTLALTVLAGVLTMLIERRL